MAKEQFFYPESAELLKTLDEAARRSGVSRGQAFEDFLQMTVCSLSGGRMEEQYLSVVKKHSHGKPGRRGCDSIAELFAKSVAAMETDETRGEMKDILGELQPPPARPLRELPVPDAGGLFPILHFAYAVRIQSSVALPADEQFATNHPSYEKLLRTCGRRQTRALVEQSMLSPARCPP